MGESTKAIVLYVLKTDVATARKNVEATADRLALRVDGVVQSSKVLSTKLTFTITGAPEQIEALREIYEGDGWRSGGDDSVVGFLLNPVIDGVLGGAQRALARGWRTRKLREDAEVHGKTEDR